MGSEDVIKKVAKAKQFANSLPKNEIAKFIMAQHDCLKIINFEICTHKQGIQKKLAPHIFFCCPVITNSDEEESWR